jgi:hypothetical protein
VAIEHRAKGLAEQAEIETQGRMLDIPDVEIESLGPTEGVSSRDLRQPGDPGANPMATTVMVGIERKVLLDERARSDQTHVTAQHVDQFRELVERSRTQSSAEGRDASIIGQELTTGITLVGHRAKLEQLERTIAEADAALAEEHGTTEAHAHRDADDQ